MSSLHHRRLTYASRTLLLSLALLVLPSCNMLDPLNIAGQEDDDHFATRQAIEGTQRAHSATMMAAMGTSIAQTQAALASLEAEMHAAQTEEAAPISREDAIKTAQAEAAVAAQIEAPPAAQLPPVEAPAPALSNAAPAPGSSPPVITRVDFPKAIPASGIKFVGWTSFKDPDGDVVIQRMEVVSSVSMKGFESDPRDGLFGSTTDGRYDFRIWCFRKQEVVMRVTLIDAAGNQSNSMEFSFECY